MLMLRVLRPQEILCRLQLEPSLCRLRRNTRPRHGNYPEIGRSSRGNQCRGRQLPNHSRCSGRGIKSHASGNPSCRHGDYGRCADECRQPERNNRQDMERKSHFIFQVGCFVLNKKLLLVANIDNFSVLQILRHKTRREG